nr:hypothetical protein [uncultured Ligilactobacillus sp.]
MNYLVLAAILIVPIPLYTFCIYLICTYFKKIYSDNEKIASWFYILILFMVGLLLIFIGIVTLCLYNYFHKYTSKDSAATLTGSTFTVVSIIVTAGGLLYTNRQNKIQKLHSESNWRGRLLDLEKKPVYTTDDLLELNSFINPYHKKNDNLDYLISFAIKTIIETHLHPENNNDDEFLPFYKLVSDSKISNKLKEILQRDNPNVPNTFGYINTKFAVHNEKLNTLYSEENIIIRKCIHALLKNDWMNVNG